MVKIMFFSVSVLLFYLAELLFFSLRYLTLHVECISLDVSSGEEPISMTAIYALRLRLLIRMSALTSIKLGWCTVSPFGIVISRVNHTIR